MQTKRIDEIINGDKHLAAVSWFACDSKCAASQQAESTA
jgi:hypothetical protein